MVISKDWITLHKGSRVLLVIIASFFFAFSSLGEEVDIFVKKNNDSIADDRFELKKMKTGERAFVENSKTDHVFIPEGVCVIDSSAFEASTIKSVTLPKGLLIIGENAFSGCHNLTDIILPDGLYAIGRGAFAECSNLTSITIPASVRYIGTEAFAKTNIHNIYFKTTDCCVEDLFLFHTASATDSITLHFPEYAEDDEIGDIDAIIGALNNASNLQIVYDVICD